MAKSAKAASQFDSRIGKLRRKQGFSQREVAAEVGVTENTAASWDRTIPNSFAIAFKICRYFNEEIETQFNGDELQALRHIADLRQNYRTGAISQRELASTIGVTENTIGNWEKEEHQTIEKLAKLCHKLGCEHLSDLYEWIAADEAAPGPATSGPAVPHPPHSNSFTGTQSRENSSDPTPSPDPTIAPSRQLSGLGSSPQTNGPKYQLIDIVGVSLCASLSGAKSEKDIERYGYQQQSSLKKCLPLAQGIPTAASISQVFGALDPEFYPSQIQSWINAVAHLYTSQWVKHNTSYSDTAVAIEEQIGAVLSSKISLDSEYQFTISRDSRDEASEPSPATISQWIKVLNLHRCVVSVDTLNCPPHVAQQIREKNGDYIIRLRGEETKELQQYLEPLVTWAKQKRNDLALASAMPCRAHQEILPKENQLPEERRYWLVSGIKDYFTDMSYGNELRLIGLAQSKCRILGPDITTQIEETYYLLNFNESMEGFKDAIAYHWNNDLLEDHWTVSINTKSSPYQSEDLALERIHDLRKPLTQIASVTPQECRELQASKQNMQQHNHHLAEIFSRFLTLM